MENQAKQAETPKEDSKPKPKTGSRKKYPSKLAPTKRRLTLKQQAFVNEYIKNRGNGTLSALNSYNIKEKTVANAIAVENLQKPSIIDEVRAASQRAGLTVDRAITRLNQVMEQDKYVVPAVSLWADMTGYKQKADVNVNVAVLDEQSSRAITDKVRELQRQAIDIT